MKYRPVSPDPDLPDQEKYGTFGREHSEAEEVKADEKICRYCRNSSKKWLARRGEFYPWE